MSGFASQDQVLALLKHQSSIPRPVILLDVRTDEEIKSSGSLATSPICSEGKASWVHCSVSPTDASELEQNAGTLVGEDKDVPVIVYCRSGRRAQFAKEVLESKGFSSVLNAGGWDNLDYLK